MPHEPGEFYLRPCVFSTGRWWPVLDINPHTDPEIGEERLHVHVDERFLPDDVWALQKPAPEASLFLVTCVKDVEFFAYRKIKCHRRHVPKAPSRQRIDLEELEEVCSHLRMETDLFCPHRGAPLHDAPLVDGCLQCPAHGMHWNQKTGELVPRYTQAKHAFERKRAELETEIDDQIRRIEALLAQ